MNRRAVAGLLALAMVGSGGAGWLASTSIRSPAETAARTAPPEPSPILVPAEKRALAAKVVTRGTARFGAPQRLSLMPSALKSVGGVVASVAGVGEERGEGDVLMLQSGRPVFVLQGDLPSFRDLGPGLAGDDVTQLQEALSRMGFAVRASGAYDARTEAAIAAWYRAAGFEPFTATDEQLADIRAREAELATASIDALTSNDDVARADADVVVTRVALDRARSRAEGGPADVAAARAAAEAAVAAAQADIEGKQAALDELRNPRPPSVAEVARAEADLATKAAEAEATRIAGQDAVAEAKAVFDRAGAAVTDAEAALTDALAVGADEVAAAQAALGDAEADPALSDAELAAARAALTRAQADAATAAREARAVLADAQATGTRAPGALAAARSQATEADAAAAAEVAAARAALAAARAGSLPPTVAELAAARADLAQSHATAALTATEGAQRVADAEDAAASAMADLQGAAAGLHAAETIRDDARDALVVRQRIAALGAADLGTARRRAGVQVPADEVVVVRQAPIRVSEVTAAPGDPASGPVMVVTNAVVAVDGSLPIEDAQLVQPGMTVQIDEPDLGIRATGSVTQVAASPGTNGVDGFHVYFEVAVDGNPPNLAGVSVRLTIAIDSSGEPTLVVPVSAVSLDPDGSSRVFVDRKGTLEPVVVEPGLAADGFVAVNPVGGSLEPGDLVQAGVEPVG